MNHTSTMLLEPMGLAQLPHNSGSAMEFGASHEHLGTFPIIAGMPKRTVQLPYEIRGTVEQDSAKTATTSSASADINSFWSGRCVKTGVSSPADYPHLEKLLLIKTNAVGAFSQVGGQDAFFMARSEIESELLSALEFENNWDGYEGAPPCEQAVHDAIAALREIPSYLEAPESLIAGDGEVGFYWRRKAAYIEASFYGDGKVNYFARNENREVIFKLEEAEIPSGRRPPQGFLDAVEFVFPGE